MIQVIGLGAGGHTKVVIEILQLLGKYELVGLLDPDRKLWNEEILSVPVLGGDERIPELYAQGIQHAFIGIGTIGDTRPRKRLYEKAKESGFQIVDAIHPRAVISPSAEHGEGITIMAGAVINAKTRLGDNVIVNSGAIVEHDCYVGSHVHVATGVHVAGGVRLAEGVHVGLGASILQGVYIGKNVIVGAGSVVINDVGDDETVIGIPANPIKGKS